MHATQMISDYWKRRVNRVMDHVRNNPISDLRLETIAEVANSSPYHFHRIFKAVAGETVAEFVRRSRLERAAYLMKARPRRTLTSIAFEVGFPTSADFSRAFKRQHGISPSKWDRKSRLDAARISESVGTIGSACSGGLSVRVVTRPACRLAYIRMRTWFQVEILQPGFDHLTRWLDSRGVDWRATNMVGMSWDHYETTPLDQVHYDLAFPVSEDVSGDAEIGIYELPSLRAAEVHCVGELAVVARAWDCLYNEWFPSSSYEPANLPAMKRFRRRPDEIGWDRWDLDCSIALQEALP